LSDIATTGVRVPTARNFLRSIVSLVLLNL
jgi:hypothetical protein